DDDRAVLEACLAHARDGLHPREILRARRRDEPDLGSAAVELGAQLVGGRDTDDTMTEERDAIAEPVGLVEIMRAEEDRPTRAAKLDDELAYRLRGIGIEP